MIITAASVDFFEAEKLKLVCWSGFRAEHGVSHTYLSRVLTRRSKFDSWFRLTLLSVINGCNFNCTYNGQLIPWLQYTVTLLDAPRSHPPFPPLLCVLQQDRSAEKAVFFFFNFFFRIKDATPNKLKKFSSPVSSPSTRSSGPRRLPCLPPFLTGTFPSSAQAWYRM